MSNRTFTMIKPDAFRNGHSGAILDRIIKEGYAIRALKLIHLSAEKAGQFYAVHKARPFYGELVAFMSSGPIIAAILEKENAVESFRKLIGATDPAKAEEGTILKCSRLLLEKMPFMAVTLTKMLRSKEISFSPVWSNADLKNWKPR